MLISAYAEALGSQNLPLQGLDAISRLGQSQPARHIFAMVKPNPSAIKPETFAARLLAWYDVHRRDLPWRAKPGEPSDPYRVWLSEIMLQQTTVEAVKPYFERFTTRWPTVDALASDEEQVLLTAWAGLGYYARARNLMACARRILVEYGGVFPRDEARLRALPGIGDYTAAAITSIAFDQRALVMDGNVERVVTRFFAIETPVPAAKPLIKAKLELITPHARAGDFAQGMMDLGSGICTPKNPSCLICPLKADCMAYHNGEQTRFPLKAAKKPKPVRHGVAFIARDDEGRILLRTRPPKGLLASMAEVPTTDWVVSADGFTGIIAPPLQADWQVLNTQIVHVFTHFELRLSVQTARVSMQPAPEPCRWVAHAALEQEPLPTLMKKVLQAAVF